jgi:hypothetical protein
MNEKKKVNSPKGAVGSCSPDCTVNNPAIVIMQIFMMESYHADFTCILVVSSVISFIIVSKHYCDDTI